MKPLRLSSELIYIAALAMMAFAVSLTAAADFGVSMVVAPAYILSLKIPFLTFGQAEYIVQGILFVALCVTMRRFRPLYLVSFATGLLYGVILDAWRLIPFLSPEAVGTAPMPVRIAFLITGMVLTSLSVALLFHVYIYPQVYDFFVKGVAARYQLNRTRFKQGFDASCLIVSAGMSLLLFGAFNGIGWGTLLMTVCNGVIIGFFDRLIGRTTDIRPTFGAIASRFEDGIQ
ncbi:MAG: hypothetical protein E7553_06890 [Ruminococcaceae bacterium]|nr:hypothetical protein [Oscillospiraceae bacterium]